MNRPDLRTLAVITGDIVGSTEIGPARLERAMQALADSARSQEDWHGAPLRFTRNRGDGWQVALTRPERALRSALAFRAALKACDESFDSTMGLAEGPAPAALPADLNEATAPAFAASGALLEHVRARGEGQRIACDGDGGRRAAIMLADHISQGWTGAQAAAMQIMLTPDPRRSYTFAARLLGKSRQAVTKSLEAAGHQPLERALRAMEEDAGHV